LRTAVTVDVRSSICDAQALLRSTRKVRAAVGRIRRHIMSTSFVVSSSTIVPRAATLLLLSCIAIAAPAQAQMTVSPSGGISGEGQPTVAAAVGMSFGAVRSEVELGWARRGIDRRAATPAERTRSFLPASEPAYLPAAMADVSTLMFRLTVPIWRGRTIEPFATVGAGLARATRQPPPGESLTRMDTQAGIEGGGGATVWLNSRIGLRAMATYYKVVGPNGNFNGAPGTGRVYTNVLRDFSLTRVTVGIDIRLSRAKHVRPE
jgi:hypothetical protein